MSRVKFPQKVFRLLWPDCLFLPVVLGTGDAEVRRMTDSPLLSVVDKVVFSSPAACQAQPNPSYLVPRFFPCLLCLNSVT